MTQPAAVDSGQSLIDLSPQTLIQVAVLGAGLGALSWVLTALIRQVVFVPLFCGDPSSSMCVGATGGAGVIALIITMIAGLLGLVRLGVYRPLLVVLAAGISLWGLAGWTAELFWVEALLWSVLLHLFIYAAFTWLVRPRSFPLALGAAVIVVVLIRLVTML